MSLPRVAPIYGVCILVLTTACSLFSGDTIVESVPVDSIDVLSHTERSLSVAVTGSWRNTCGEVSRFESTRDDQTYRRM